MSENNTLEATLREVIGETMKPQETESKETNQANVVTSEETKSGEPSEKDFVGGIDISDVPEQDRPRIKELLSKKISLVEKGAQAKFQEIAKYKKEKESLLNAGLTEDEAVTVLRNHVQQKQNPVTKTEQKEALRTLDKMIKDADVNTAASLNNLRQVILEETGTADLKKELDEIKRQMGFVNNERATTRVQSLNNSLNALTENYGKEFIDKYRDEIVKQGLQYPQAEIKRLITAIADPDDMEQAILSRATRVGKTNIEKKLAAISNPNSGVTGSIDNIDIKKTNMKGLLGSILSARR